MPAASKIDLGPPKILATRRAGMMPAGDSSLVEFCRNISAENEIKRLDMFADVRVASSMLRVVIYYHEKSSIFSQKKGGGRGKKKKRSCGRPNAVTPKRSVARSVQVTQHEGYRLGAVPMDT